MQPFLQAPPGTGARRGATDDGRCRRKQTDKRAGVGTGDQVTGMNPDLPGSDGEIEELDAQSGCGAGSDR